jgi:hypothetical protein
VYQVALISLGNYFIVPNSPHDKFQLLSRYLHYIAQILAGWANRAPDSGSKNRKCQTIWSDIFYGSGDWARTSDLVVNSDPLYH